MRQGHVVVQGGRASLQLGEGEQAQAVEPERGLAPVAEGDAAAVTLLAHDGAGGQLVTTSGPLSFRGGDFFTGRDKELMRLSEDGALDVSGQLLARGGIRFADGTLLKSARGARAVGAVKAEGGDAPAAAGSGTVDRLAKWVETGGEGALGDSIVTAVGANVAINTATPINALEVRKDQAFAGTVASMTQAVIRNDNANGFSTFALWGTAQERGRWQFNAAFPNIFMTSIGQIPLHFGTNDTVRMTVDAAGNVGVGTTGPQAKLDVAGDLRVTGNVVALGNIAAKYQDVAEWVPARGRVPVGTVVVVARTHANTVEPSACAYETRVAGVVSAQPGVILGEAGEGKAMVATTGRVKVRVDATRRPIRIGDLLVTGAKPGVAMKSLPLRVGGKRLHRPGTIIGKALEALAGGEGEILVLLSLQ